MRETGSFTTPPSSGPSSPRLHSIGALALDATPRARALRMDGGRGKHFALRRPPAGSSLALLRRVAWSEADTSHAALCAPGGARTLDARQVRAAKRDPRTRGDARVSRRARRSSGKSHCPRSIILLHILNLTANSQTLIRGRRRRRSWRTLRSLSRTILPRHGTRARLASSSYAASARTCQRAERPP